MRRQKKIAQTISIYILFISILSCSKPDVERPNIIILFADDISARELPVYGSGIWTAPFAAWPGKRQPDTSDPQFRAHTPVLDKLAEQGCYIGTTWAATICSPSRAMMMTGRYAHLHKWWFNGDFGTYINDAGENTVWPLYESSPLLIGHVAKKAGYRTMWVGKTQMHQADLTKFGFESGVFTPGEDVDNATKKLSGDCITDFRLISIKGKNKKSFINLDSGEPATYSWAASSFFWQPSVSLMNAPYGTNNREWWPNTPESKASYGVSTYGPDVELDFSLKFIEQQHHAGKPFFVYHCSHLGHNEFDFLNQGKVLWPATPLIEWTGDGYVRTEPEITGDKGVYDTHGTLTSPGQYNHVNYLDYQVWRYQKKLRELGIEDNTVFIFCADNGSWPYGKGTSIRQRGTHVPLIIYAPGMTKHGRQDILVNLADILPTIADITGYEIPENYEMNGESLWPYLTTDKKSHRDWIYSYQMDKQLIRGQGVMRDGNVNWWDVSKEPVDLDSYPKIKDWSKASEVQREEKAELESILPFFDKHETEHDAVNK